MRISTLRLVAVLLPAGALAACGSSTGPSRILPGMLRFNVGTAAKATPPSGRRAAWAVTKTTDPTTGAVSYADGTNTLVLESVQLVLAKIELARPEAQNCEVAAPDSTVCDELQLQPAVVSLPLSAGGVIPDFAVPVDIGTFNRLQLEIHTVSDVDAALAAAHPELKGASIRVVGHYNGAAFAFTTNLDVEQTLDLRTPTHPDGVVVTATTPLNLSLMVDVSTWFQTAGKLVDPTTALAGAPNEDMVKANIRASFKSFEDENLDGIPD